jgi:hypothetical protein
LFFRGEINFNRFGRTNPYTAAAAGAFFQIDYRFAFIVHLNGFNLAFALAARAAGNALTGFQPGMTERTFNFFLFFFRHL